MILMQIKSARYSRVLVVTELIVSGTQSVQGMYKRSEPIRLQHSVQTEYCFRSPSEMCPKFPKFLKFVRSSGIIYLEILLIFDNYHVLECF